MPTASAITAFVRRPRTTDNRGLIVEQRPWPDATGKVTRLTLIGAIAARLYGSDTPEVDCGVDVDGFNTAVYVYAWDQDLAYDCGLTHGTMQPVMREEVEIREAVSFTLTTEAALKYPLRSLVSVEWLDDVWDGNGAVLARPSLSVDDNNVVSSQPIYGSAEVVYTVLRDTYPIHIFPRGDAAANVFQSVFWAAWDGGVKLCEIDSPPGAEEDYAADKDCRGGIIILITPADDPDLPPEPTRDREITLDYCEDFQ